MVLGTLLAVSLGYQSVYLRVKAPPETKVEYRITLNMDAGSEGTLEAFIVSGCRILSNVKSQYRCRNYISDSKVIGSGMFREESHTVRDLKGMSVDYNRTSMNATASAWNDFKKVNGNPMLDGFTDFIFPEAPVVVGGTWSQDQMLGGQMVRMNYELVGFGTSNISRTALVEGYIADGQAVQSMQPNQYVVDLETGLVRRSSGKYVFTVDDLNIVTSFKVVRSALLVPPPPILNKQPAKKAPTKKPAAKPKPKSRKRP